MTVNEELREQLLKLSQDAHDNLAQVGGTVAFRCLDGQAKRATLRHISEALNAVQTVILSLKSGPQWRRSHSRFL